LEQHSTPPLPNTPSSRLVPIRSQLSPPVTTHRAVRSSLGPPGYPRISGVMSHPTAPSFCCKISIAALKVWDGSARRSQTSSRQTVTTKELISGSRSFDPSVFFSCRHFLVIDPSQQIRQGSVHLSPYARRLSWDTTTTELCNFYSVSQGTLCVICRLIGREPGSSRWRNEIQAK